MVMGGFNGLVTIKNVECYCEEQNEWSDILSFLRWPY